MIQSPPTMFDLKLFATALLSGRSLDAVIAEFGPGPGEDMPISLAGVSPDALEDLRGSKVLPTAGVCQYLATDDDLTDSIIDNMELALERDYGISAPFFITSHRLRSEQGLKVDYFFLDRE